MLSQDLALSCGFVQKASLSSSEFDQLVQKLQAIDLGDLHSLKGWLTHWSRRWEFPWCFNAINSLLEAHSDSAYILESGCGLTPLPFWLASQNHHVVGIDLDQGYLDKWQRSYVPCCTNSGSATFKVADMQNLPFEDQAFDLAYSVSALEHVTKPSLAVSEICRVVKSGGGIVLTFDVDISNSHAIQTEEFIKIQKILQEQCKFQQVHWCNPDEILTFESRTIQKQPRAKTALKNCLHSFNLKKKVDFCIYTFIGQKL